MSDTPIKEIRWTDKTAVVDITGDIDLHRSSALQQGLLSVLDQKPEKIVINLSDVPYMDSSGVASLVKILSKTRKSGVTMALAEPSAKVRGIFEITRLDSVFKIFGTEQEALG